ncbi:general transcription factor IIE subunit 1 [Callorhinchus milii]|uniref:General transcription factor IIE subunit 1 n=1 Tax=Callorhinchus milii TaxID=7868 RepID=V9KTS0_CALMI|nr:general transcription factor IIE subunit 1 [Callorhinchus milii]XP_042190619.1 general transcription factor IIE subunit 1 [Callorhinchus milii]XP_042190620.1 general transcription factor IIE subunit 1 [Callorhinchus milii]|eukprot:gi/632980196/ref/XP_007906897.1/ PREDICTED: general transcription factor IIE subunit 1 [Callorhinchus milii]
MTDPDVLTEVPASLKRLAKYVVRGFYGLEHALALDILIRNPCVKEEDMLELLKFDRKQLRSVLNTLKNDKFIKSRMRVETAPDGKTTRHNYYFINYRLLVNVVKYKLDHMRRRIETDERDSTNRASFRCPTCSNTFTDLEANQLFDLMTGTFRCTFCHTEVEEDESALPKKDARTLLARFNEQIEPIYALLRETEDINLAYEILEPEPTEIPSLKSSQRAAGSGNMSGPQRESWANKGPTYQDLYTQNVIINVEEHDVQNKMAPDEKPTKERPIWMRESTVRGGFAEVEEVQDDATDVDPYQDHEGKGNPIEANEEVMQTLLIHEKKSTSAAVAAAAAIPTSNASDSESDTSESEDESPRPFSFPEIAPAADEDDEFEEVEDEPTVLVAGQPYSYSQVSQRPELVTQMTAEEKEAYIDMGQRMFQDMYD